MEPPVVMISSDHALIWRTLRSVLSESGFDPEHVPRCGERSAPLRMRKPAVLVVDLIDTPVSRVPVEIEETFTHLDAVDAVDAGCRVLLLCEQVDSELAGELVRHGVHGVFTPDMPLELFAKAVGKVIEAEMWFSRSQVGSLLEGLDRSRTGLDPQWRRVAKPPTPRETEVLRLMAAGCDQAQIALHLDVSQHTVRTHIRNVASKLGARSRTDAVRVAIGMGLIDPSTDPEAM